MMYKEDKGQDKAVQLHPALRQASPNRC